MSKKFKLLLLAVGGGIPSLIGSIITFMAIPIIMVVIPILVIIGSMPGAGSIDENGQIDTQYYENLLNIRSEIYDTTDILFPFEYIYATDSVLRENNYENKDFIYVTYEDLDSYVIIEEESKSFVDVNFTMLGNLSTYNPEIIEAMETEGYTTIQMQYWVYSFEIAKAFDLDTNHDLKLSIPLQDDYIISAMYEDDDYIVGFNHHGVDFVAINGNWTVLSSMNGTVVDSNSNCPQNDGYNVIDNCNGGRGNYITIKSTLETGEVYYLNYYHLKSVNVDLGETVTDGQEIGVAGNSGRTTGRHLHFEIKDSNGGSFDPLPYFAL